MHPFNLENYFYKVNLHNQVKKYLFLKQTMVLFLQIRNIYYSQFWYMILAKYETANSIVYL